MAHDDTLHLHFDPLGGVAGDMVVAAMLDAFPEFLGEAMELARRIGAGVGLHLDEARDKGLRGMRLRLDLPSERGPRHYPDYLELVGSLAPDAGVAARAKDILTRLGRAEARVHNVPLERVHFHEISDWDSVTDILIVSLLLERARVAGVSAAALPLGSGRVNTEHGPMPVPAPATLELIDGLDTIDDGIKGERVTPTGAAILAHLVPGAGMPAGGWRLVRRGYGLGTRQLEGVANALRVTLWRPGGSEAALDLVSVLSFHVDDQTPEDLAIGLDRLRGHPGVLDVLQSQALGKKSRMVVRVEIICNPDAEEAVSEACFGETTTIGVRIRTESRKLLPRSVGTIDGVRIKRVERPTGTTIKPENDDIAAAGDRAARDELSRRVHANAGGISNSITAKERKP